MEPFQFYVEAFRELSTCRQSGFGSSPIPFTAIVEYSKIYEVDDFHEFLDIIRKMDAEYLKLDAQSQKKQSNGSNAKTSKKN